MKKMIIATTALLMATMSPTAYGQLSVTTIGATDAALCYKHAKSKSKDTLPCTQAIKDSTTTRQDLVKTHINRGIIYNRRLKLQEAVDDFNKALKLAPMRGEAYANRGTSFFLADRFNEALKDYQKALELNTDLAWATWYNIGLTYDAQKQPEKAQNAYRKSLTLKPGFTLAADKITSTE